MKTTRYLDSKTPLVPVDFFSMEPIHAVYTVIRRRYESH
jgi:hypothetical protein